MESNIRSVVILIAIGTICWLVAGVVAVVMGADPEIMWSCICGAILGVIGIRYTIRRARRSGI
ncbi:MAG: hypothetical protein CK518_01650 [Actinobacteria bacterium]|nr:DUF2530 domain-containing protein [Candidatus Planktophila sp.]PHX66954.1 MAG: hypothetical protein CK518_01650 [Actinomycetota bacterium]